MSWRSRGLAIRGHLCQHTIEVRWPDPVNYCVDILVGCSKAPETTSQRVSVRAVGFRPASGYLDEGDGIVTTAESNALAGSIAIFAFSMVIGNAARHIGALI